MTSLEHEHFRELARQVATGTASEAEHQELEAMLRQEPSLKEDLDQIRSETLLLREALPLIEAIEAPARPFPAYARERLQTKVRETLGRREASQQEDAPEKLRNPLKTSVNVSYLSRLCQAEASELEDFECLPPPRRTKVLLVDDDRSFTGLLKTQLEAIGRYLVRVENVGENALAAVREYRPDLVLLDLIMPRVPGGNISAAMLNDPELRDTPVVFLTAAVRKHQVEEHAGIICDRPTLAKPCSLEKVIEAIEQYAQKPAD